MLLINGLIENLFVNFDIALEPGVLSKQSFFSKLNGKPVLTLSPLTGHSLYVCIGTTCLDLHRLLFIKETFVCVRNSYTVFINGQYEVMLKVYNIF